MENIIMLQIIQVKLGIQIVKLKLFIIIRNGMKILLLFYIIQKKLKKMRNYYGNIVISIINEIIKFNNF